jgi:hypothetical protein
VWFELQSIDGTQAEPVLMVMDRAGPVLSLLAVNPERDFHMVHARYAN